MKRQLGVLVVWMLLASACGEEREWQVASSGLSEALMGVSGTSEKDVWAVGADTGSGPLVLHFDGTTWERRATGTKGHLWWVHAIDATTAFFGGVRGEVLEWNGSTFVRHATPALARQTVFGIWASAKNDVWAVGSGTSGRRGFLWHYDGAAWTDVPLPADVPLRGGESPGLFKVWGRSKDDVWVAGADGVVLHKDASGWTVHASGRNDTLFTVAGNAKRLYLVGGGSLAGLLESDGTTFTDRSPDELSLLQGVAADPTDDEHAIATGEGGAVFERAGGAWKKVDTKLADLGIESLHAAWIDPKGRVWAVGGKVVTTLTTGAIIRYAPPKGPTYEQPSPPTPPDPVCPAAQIDPAPGASIARRWNEQILGAIRRDLPRPTVHARNLFQLSAAMWDAWATYDATAKGVFVTEKNTATDLAAARDQAISYAAYRVLLHRYGGAAGGPIDKVCFKAFMDTLGYDVAVTSTDGSSPAAIGNRIAAAIIEFGKTDGANEQNNYADTTGFMATNTPLPVEGPSAPADDIDHWQPLDLAIASTQNGIPLAPGVQVYVGAHWGKVTPFAMTRTGSGTYMDAGTPPSITPEHMGWVVELIQKSHDLAPTAERSIDISPGAYGNNPLGTNDGTGHPLNPATGQPYAAQRVPMGDFGRVMAEFWADGPKSETPPGHWNVIMNRAFDHPSFLRKWHGDGEVLDRLQFDVRAYLAVNGALHDAAIAAWEIKRADLCSRPITHVRTSGGRGQSSDPSKASYDPRGRPLIDALIELITPESSAAGQRHEALRPFVGQIAVNVWRGEAGDVSRVSGNGWLRAAEWVPYQKRDFVSPAFPGFISGHSTFSRAAAEVLTRITGTPFFPGGILEQPIAANSTLTFEGGPSVAFTLQWATYFDAADQAGQSRLWGGIHIQPDDFIGRRVGAQVGDLAFTKAESYF